MAITKMKHLRLFGMGTDREVLLDQLQKLGCVQISLPTDQLADPQWAALTQVDDDGLTLAKQEAGQLESALTTLRKCSPEKTGLLAPRRSVAYGALFDDALRHRALATAQAIGEQERILSALDSEEVKLATQKVSLTPWLNLDVPLETQGTQTVSATFGTLMATTDLSAVVDQLQAVNPLVEIISAGTDREFQYILLLCHRSAEEAVFDALKPFGFSRTSLRGWTGTAAENLANLNQRLAQIKDERTAAQAAIATHLPARQDLQICADRVTQDIQRESMKGRLLESQATFFLEGWCPAKQLSQVESLLGQYTTAWESRDPLEGEYGEVPVQLDNNALTKPLNMVTEMYALPAYDGIDPNPLMAPFFITFYGIMMADMGYGLIMMLAAFLVNKKAKPQGGMKNLLGLLGLCGISTFIVGALTGSFFGDFITQLMNIVQPGSNVTLPYLFTPLNNTMDVLIGSLVIGAIQTITGMVISVVKQGKDGNIKDAFFNEITWWIILGGLGLSIAGFGPWVMAGGFVLLAVGQFLSKGILGGLAGLLGALYNGVTGFFSDILSYSRLMALMLAGSIISQVFNTLGAVTGNVVGFVIIAMLGNALNFALNILGCYVHDLRLQCLEFFGRFYKDGGKPFRPLDIQTNYVNLIKEET